VQQGAERLAQLGRVVAHHEALLAGKAVLGHDLRGQIALDEDGPLDQHHLLGRIGKDDHLGIIATH